MIRLLVHPAIVLRRPLAVLAIVAYLVAMAVGMALHHHEPVAEPWTSAAAACECPGADHGHDHPGAPGEPASPQDREDAPHAPGKCSCPGLVALANTSARPVTLPCVAITPAAGNHDPWLVEGPSHAIEQPPKLLA